MRRVLRQDPDVILIGEMRDEETVRTALSAAETGHLVLSTLHTLDATETINRIIDFFPPHLQQQARVMLAGDAAAASSPSGSCRRADRRRPRRRLRGPGRDRPRPGPDPRTRGDRQATEVIAEGEYYGMQTFDQALLSHVHGGQHRRWRPRSRPPRARTTSSCMLDAQGQRASGIEQVMEDATADAAADRSSR